MNRCGTSPQTYYLWTIGCQMNEADSRRLADGLAALGYCAAPRAEQADLVVLNTCVVRRSAEDKVVGRLSSLKGLKSRRPGMLLAVMGCFVGDVSYLRQKYSYVDIFAAPSDVDAVLALARRRATSDQRPVISHQQPIAAYVPISTGCDHRCTYCIVRLRRGLQRSRPVGEIVAEVRELVGRGAREVTLLGQNVDAYGSDLPSSPSLADVLHAVHQIEDLWRIRFLTSHPADMTDRLIEAVATLPKVCEHIELPVQSGDDDVLRRMGRRYTVAEYRDLVARIRAAIPGTGLATDVIVGFCSESEAQFQNTYRLLEELRFDMVHVAAYSPRPGTPAARWPDDVPPAEKERRRQAVDDLQKRIAGEINARFLGQTVEVLVEDLHRGKWRGRTRTNKLVFFADDADWRGKLALVEITWAGPWSMLGRVRGEADIPEP
ncbi:MAG TPA: tRNA (N6-isopentenyl adenosine(37)-C2)-methylthiotransferase MiaB [Anaerolineae bacterium]|nr:tRNA (N6-isopentenyl adenosine(37)-C2)-methylthiotransferase MiaB [Anaerolineae bacterium]